MQVYVPLNTKKTSYEETKPFAKAIAQLLEKQTPDKVVSKMKKVEREGKIMVDWSQNHRSKTTIAVYSLRARERPTVSTPISWEEVEKRRRREATRRARLRSQATCSSGSRSTATSSPRSSSWNRSCPTSRVRAVRALAAVRTYLCLVVALGVLLVLSSTAAAAVRYASPGGVHPRLLLAGEPLSDRDR